MSAQSRDVPLQTMDETVSGNAKSNVKRNPKKNIFQKNNNTIEGVLKNFVGETLELGAILSLLSEKVEKGLTFDVFQERLKNFVLNTFKKAEDVTKLVTALEDTRVDFETTHGPANLSMVEAANPMLVKNEKFNTRFF